MNLLGFFSHNGRATTDQSQADGAGWLLLNYRVPPEPTRLRSTVWRRIKSLGAIYPQNPVAALRYFQVAMIGSPAGWRPAVPSVTAEERGRSPYIAVQ